MTDKKTVYQMISEVAAKMAADGISKNRKNQQQGYSFRGIDDVYNALAPIMSSVGLVVLPRVLSRECVERPTQKGGVLFYTTVEVEFDFVSSHDGSKHVVKTYGEAMDSADKSTNKAMSAAYKYACMQAFCIPTEGDNDADAVTHQPAPKAQPKEPIKLDGDALMIADAMNSATSEKQLEQIGKIRKADIDKMPEDIRHELKLVYSRKLAELKNVLMAG